MKIFLATIGVIVSLTVNARLVSASTPAATPAAPPATATAPATQPLTKTVGVHVVKRTENPDGTLTLLYRWDDKGTSRERSVIINADTVIGIGGKLSQIPDLTDAALKDVSVATVGPDMVTAVSLRVGRPMIQVSADQLSAKQIANLQEAAPRPTAASDASFDKRAADIVATLKLNSPAREARIKAIILADLLAVRDSHNAGFSPDPSVRQKFNTDIAKELLPEQIDTVKNAITGNEIDRLWSAYHIIVPGLNLEEETRIMALLKQGREALLDVKNVDEHGRALEPFKTQIEQYLTAHGHDWKQLYAQNKDKVGQ